MKLIKKTLLNHWPLIFIFIFTLVFFNRFFYPKISLFSTPGDIAYFNYPLKNFLSESLKNHQLPSWTNLIGTGFPILADSPIGAFYFPNLILFYFFPTPIAFNLHYILIFLTSTIGTYLLCRYYKLSKLSALYAALAYGFSGFFIARVIHTSFIQVASLLPFIFLLIEKFNEESKKIYFLIFSLFIAQIIFIGYLQALVYSLFTIFTYLLLKSYFNKYTKQRTFKLLALVSISILIGFILASAQILPTLEMLRLSTRSSGLGAEELFRNSGSLKILALFINPFIFGDISKGTLNSSGLGFYWENIAYSGFLTPLLAALSIFVAGKNKKIIFIFAFIAFISLLLAVGKFGPAHVFFDIPPFSFFRIPARFLFITSFSIAILSAYSINSLKNKVIANFLGAILILVITVDIFKSWYIFNPYTKENLYLKTPEVVSFLKENLEKDNTRVTALWPYLQKSQPLKDWNKDTQEHLWDFNSLNPNLNMVYNLPSSDFYTSLSTRRLDLIRIIYRSNIKLENKDQASITSAGINLLKLQSVKYILTPFKINNNSLNEVKTLQSPSNNYQIHIYQIADTLPRFRLSKDYEVATSVSDLVTKLQLKDFNPSEKVILEKEPPRVEVPLTNATVISAPEKDNNLTLKVKSNGQGFLVVSDSYYPGWEASVNNKQTEVLAANGNSRAIFINSGESTITLSYKPSTVKIGLIISLLSHLIIIGLLFAPQKFFKGLSSYSRLRASA